MWWNEQHLNIDDNFDHLMSLSKRKFWYYNNYLHFSKCVVLLDRLYIVLVLDIRGKTLILLLQPIHIFKLWFLNKRNKILLMLIGWFFILLVEKNILIEWSHLANLSQGLVQTNGTAQFKKCKQLFRYQHLLLLKDIWCSKL